MLKRKTKSLPFSFSFKCYIKVDSGEEGEELKEIAEGKKCFWELLYLESGRSFIVSCSKMRPSFYQA